MQGLSLRELKGAPLSIVIALMIAKQPVSNGYLCRETGYSDKSIAAGVKFLEDHQIITRCGYAAYQLTGDSYQLPLSWDERIDAMEAERKISGGSGKIPELAERVADLELRVAALEGFRKNSGSAGEFPELASAALYEPDRYDSDESGEIPEVPEKFRIEESEEFRKNSGGFGEIPEVSENFRFEDPEDFRKNSGTVGKIPELSENFRFEVEAGANSSKDILINNQVSKQVSNQDTYLLPDNGIEVNLTTGSGKIPEASGEIPDSVMHEWNAAAMQIKGQTGNNVLDRAKVVRFADGEYTVELQNGYDRDWCETRLTNSLVRILAGISGEKRTVRFVAASVEQNIQERKEKTEAVTAAPSVELLPIPEDAKAAELTEICNDYLLEPEGLNYSREQLLQLIGKNPDPKLLRFVLPRAGSFDVAWRWCRHQYRVAKMNLMREFGITGTAQSEIAAEPEISLELIDFWYWTFEDDPEKDVVKDAGLIIDRIKSMNSKMAAETHAPLRTMYLTK